MVGGCVVSKGTQKRKQQIDYPTEGDYSNSQSLRELFVFKHKNCEWHGKNKYPTQYPQPGFVAFGLFVRYNNGLRGGFLRNGFSLGGNKYVGFLSFSCGVSAVRASMRKILFAATGANFGLCACFYSAVGAEVAFFINCTAVVALVVELVTTARGAAVRAVIVSTAAIFANFHNHFLS